MVSRLTTAAIQTSLLTLHPDWSLNRKMDQIQRRFSFKNFHQAMAFANATAWIAHQNDHHPEMRLTFDSCKVIYTTHSIQGLSALDFNCAKAVDALIQT